MPTIGRKKSQVVSIENIKQMVTDANEKIWTIKSFAQEMCMTSDAVKKRIYRGQIPAHKKGRSWYILRSEYLKFLKENRKPLNNYIQCRPVVSL